MNRLQKIISDDPLQVGYTYVLEAAAGKDFDNLFAPELTPQQMLQLGVFDGWYFEGVPKEFPKKWFTRARLSTDGSDPTLNFFKIHASQTREVWRRKGWISEWDPRGWFQWYCRYFLGRRIPDEDARQIKRWRAIKRHVAQIQKSCWPGDLGCRRRQRQAVLHWAYDSRKI